MGDEGNFSGLRKLVDRWLAPIPGSPGLDCRKSVPEVEFTPAPSLQMLKRRSTKRKSKKAPKKSVMDGQFIDMTNKVRLLGVENGLFTACMELEDLMEGLVIRVRGTVVYFLQKLGDSPQGRKIPIGSIRLPIFMDATTLQLSLTTTEGRGERRGGGSRGGSLAGSRHGSLSSEHSEDLDPPCPVTLRFEALTTGILSRTIVGPDHKPQRQVKTKDGLFSLMRSDSLQDLAYCDYEIKI